MLAILALSIAIRKTKLVTGSAPFSLTAIVIRLEIFVKTADRFASTTALALLVVAHFECPDIVVSRTSALAAYNPGKAWLYGGFAGLDNFVVESSGMVST